MPGCAKGGFQDEAICKKMMNIVVQVYILVINEKAAKRRVWSVSEFVEQLLLAKASEVLSDPYRKCSNPCLQLLL